MSLQKCLMCDIDYLNDFIKKEMIFFKEIMFFFHRIRHIINVLTNYSYYSMKLARFGWKSTIDRPLRINGENNIYIGNRVFVQYKTWLAAEPLTGESKCQLIIEEGCTIGHFNHIYATQSVILRKDVLTADKVYISDNLHGYEDITIPVHEQPIVQKGTVEIGEGSWLGENVCVIGANIGKHCVIGANSVVTSPIPDYCVAVGAPAKVVKRYDFNQNKWIRVL